MSNRVRDVSIKVDSPYCLKALNDNIKKCGMTVIFRRQLWIREWQRKWNETAWILAWQHWLLGTLKADVQVGAWGQLIGKTLYRCFLKCLLLECSVLPNDPCESAARRLSGSSAMQGMEEGVQSFPHLEAQRGILENLSIYSMDIIFQSRSARLRTFQDFSGLLVSWDNSQSKQKCPIP